MIFGGGRGATYSSIGGTGDSKAALGAVVDTVVVGHDLLVAEGGGTVELALSAVREAPDVAGGGGDC